jgi:probable F420-dependent oxidoreductase
MLVGIQGSGQLAGVPPDPGRFRAVAELAEELGYDSIWAGEHLSFHNPILDLGVALAAFATVTERVRIGAAVVLLPLRHPSLVAKQAASLDYLSGGRLVLGVGVGGEGPKDFEAAGVDVQERGARADDAIRALRALFGPPPASFTGRFHSFEGIELAPRSPRPAGPPLLVGGRSPAAHRRAGALGDGWLPYLVSPRRFAAGVDAVRGHALEAGRDPDLLEHVLVTFARVGDDGQAVREQVRAHLSHRYRMQFEPHHVEHLCIAGTPEECAARIRSYAEAGVGHISLNPAADDDLLDQVARLRGVVDIAVEAAA